MAAEQYVVKSESERRRMVERGIDASLIVLESELPKSDDDFALEPDKACKINDPDCESCQ